MCQFQPPADPSTVWLKGLIEAMDEVASSPAKPSAADRKALVNRLELPAIWWAGSAEHDSPQTEPAPTAS
jgi:hypothetical protein